MTTLSDDQIQERLRDSQWRRERQAIVRELEFANFKEAIGFVNLLAAEAERANHHPDILLHGWNKVRLELSTHSQGGLTHSDFDLAERIDALL